MSFSSVLIAVVGLLVLANVVLMLRAANRCADERVEHRADGASAVGAPPPPAIGEAGAVAPERRT
jgi:hypothetical protein